MALSNQFSFNEEEFKQFQNAYSKELMDKFLDFAIIGISVAFIMRVVLMNIEKTMLDLVLPFIIFSVIATVYTLNKMNNKVK